MDYKKGDIWYVDKNPSYYAVGGEMYAGRPGVIVSNDAANAKQSTVQVAYFTTQPQTDSPTHVVIQSMAHNSVCLCEQVFTVSKDRLRDCAGRCTDREMQLIDAGLMVQFGIGFQTSMIAPVQPTDESRIAVETERDLYKKLYEDLVKKMIRNVRAYDQGNNG